MTSKTYFKCYSVKFRMFAAAADSRAFKRGSISARAKRCPRESSLFSQYMIAMAIRCSRE